MCKLFGITSTTTITRRQTDAITRAVHRSFRVTQRDGFGFTLQNPDGTRYTERYTQPGQFTGIGAAAAARKRLPDALKPAVKMDAAGIRNPGGCTSLIIHGRTSTNDITLTNTQPLSKAGWAKCADLIPLAGRVSSATRGFPQWVKRHRGKLASGAIVDKSNDPANPRVIMTNLTPWCSRVLTPANTIAALDIARNKFVAYMNRQIKYELRQKAKLRGAA